MSFRKLNFVTAALAGGGEPHATETAIAQARVLLGTTFVIAFALDRTALPHIFAFTFNLLAGYLAYSVTLLLLLRVRNEHTAGFLYAVHAGDIIWPTFIALFIDGPNSPFLLFYVFVLFAAAFRWGMRATLVTTVLLAVTVSAETIALRYGMLDRLVQGHFDLNPLLTRTGYLVVTGTLAGYLGQKQKQLRSEAEAITRLLARTRSEGVFREVLCAVLDGVMQLFRCRRAILVLKDTGSSRLLLWEAKHSGLEPVFSYRELGSADKQDYVFPAEIGVSGLRRMRSEAVASFIGSEYARPVKLPESAWLKKLCTLHQFASALLAHVQMGGWDINLLLMDDSSLTRPDSNLRLLYRIVQEVGPAVHNVYLLHRIREQAGAMERARIGRELHDGVVQCLFAIEMRLYSLRKRAAAGADVTGELKQVQDIIHDQLLSLRELISEARTPEISPDRLVPSVAEMVDKFKRDTDIAAQFVSDVQSVVISHRESCELVRIINEALVNIRKHSGARAVLVELSAYPGGLRLIVEDDGGGCEFSGRMSLAEMESAGVGPTMIKERARSIGADLAIESFAWRGTRIELTLTKEACAATA